MVGMSTGQRVSYLVSGDLASKSDWAFNVWFAIKNQRGIWKNLSSEICSPQTISKACSQLSCLLRKRVYDVDRQMIKMSRMFRLNAKLKKKMYHTLSALRYNWITPAFSQFDKWIVHGFTHRPVFKTNHNNSEKIRFICFKRNCSPGGVACRSQTDIDFSIGFCAERWYRPQSWHPSWRII